MIAADYAKASFLEKFSFFMMGVRQYGWVEAFRGLRNK